jgi:hypothetical protein
MRSLVSVLVLSGLTCLAPRIADADQPSGDLSLTIRTYASTWISREEQLSARVMAGRILHAAGLDAQWRSCDSVLDGIPDACARPIGHSDVAVRFVRLKPPAGRLPVALGYSLVDSPTRGGVLATVYLDRVAWTAAGCEVDAAMLLGLTMAHEIGHLLLGTGEHTATGLMRASWSCDDLRRDAEAKWQFGPKQAQVMRESVRRRAERGKPGPPTRGPCALGWK